MKKEIPFYILMGLTFAAILATGIIFKQSLFKIIPLFVSLVVALLNSRINRFGPLLGAFNAIWYSAVYFSWGLYASAVYSLAVSFTFQLFTFIRWSKHPYKSSTVLRRMSTKARAILASACAVAWIGLYFVLKSVGGAHSLLDDTISLLGIISSVIMLFAYIEYTWLNVPTNVLGIVLYAMMFFEDKAQITYLIFYSYSLVMNVTAFIRANKLYLKQQREEKTQ